MPWNETFKLYEQIPHEYRYAGAVPVDSYPLYRPIVMQMVTSVADELQSSKGSPLRLLSVTVFYTTEDVTIAWETEDRLTGVQGGHSLRAGAESIANYWNSAFIKYQTEKIVASLRKSHATHIPQA